MYFFFFKGERRQAIGGRDGSSAVFFPDLRRSLTAPARPARPSSPPVARPMPLPPPVTNARFPERSITAPPQCGMGNAECNGERHKANDLLLQFRIPHSAFKRSAAPRPFRKSDARWQDEFPGSAPCRPRERSARRRSGL